MPSKKQSKKSKPEPELISDYIKIERSQNPKELPRDISTLMATIYASASNGGKVNIKSVLTTYDTIADQLGMKYEPYVEVKPSPIDGNGVFAVEDIPAFTVVTMYPMDVIHSIHKNLGNGKAVMDIYGKEFKNQQVYALDHNDNGFTYFGNPDKKHPLFLGHLINDSTSIGRGSNEVIKYMLGRKFKQNCSFDSVGDIMCVRTIKDIKKGDELFIAYGLSYWNPEAVEDLMSATPQQQKLIKKLGREIEQFVKDTDKHFNYCDVLK